MSTQNDIERLKDLMNTQGLSAEEANIELVRVIRFRLMTTMVPAQIRQALNVAVKEGKLGHMKKDGHKPEAYYHPTFKHLAIEARNKSATRVLEALSGVIARPMQIEVSDD